MKFSTQRRLLSCRFLIFTLTSCIFVPMVAWLRRPAPPRVVAKRYHFPSRALADLDRVVQARFAIVPDSDFGLWRVGKRHSYFCPATQTEKSAVKNLQAANQEVVFYVVGRNTVLKQRNSYGNPPVQGPVYITPYTPLKVAPKLEGAWLQARFLSEAGVASDAPDDQDLIHLSRRVFDDDALRNGTNATVGKWRAVAQPIAASAQQCVDCHNARAPGKAGDRQPRFALTLAARRDIIVLGDTLGIALYCYQPARKTKLKHLTDDEVMVQNRQ